MSTPRSLLVGAIVLAAALAAHAAAQDPIRPPSGRLVFGFFAAVFAPDGSLTLSGEGWPPFDGTWALDGQTLVLSAAKPPDGCAAPGRYRPGADGTRFTLQVVEDACRQRRMILHGSTWRPAAETPDRPVRAITLTASRESAPLPSRAPARGSWPAFRGDRAAGVATDMNLPDTWDVKTGTNVRWRVPIPGLAHSSPIVWGDRVFVTSAISQRADATFKPGLYGDGDASDDRSVHRFVIRAIDAGTGRTVWDRVAHEGVPRQKRHIKSTYASATPATDGRFVVASFGSEGVFAYDIEGRFRWKVDLGRLDVGAYDIPSFEWGTASSPMIWRNYVFVQCDTQQDSFLLALDLTTGRTMWRTPREELPSWGTPNVVDGPRGPELVTNGGRSIRAYDPETGAELWRIGPGSKISAPTPIAADGYVVVSSGRAPERPIHVVRLGSRGDLTLPAGATSSPSVAWTRLGRGPYMPTPLIYDGRVYVLGNNGVFDAYDLATGAEVYRARAPHLGSGFSASPVGADGKLYLSGEDGDVIVVRAGPVFEHLATNAMGELIMATPALSGGVMFVRTVSSLVAIGRR